MTEQVKFINEYNTYDEAEQAAEREARAIMCPTVPAVLYRQADRYMLSASLPMTLLANQVRLDHVKKGEDPTNKRNRPLMPDHVKVISEYLQNEPNYILPPVTLNIGTELRCFTTRTETPARSAVVLLPPGLQFYVTDGQHRIAAIRDALEKRQNLQKDAISVNLVIEQDIDQIHQDFADCAQTKPIPSSLLAAFNSRNPLSPLLKRVNEEVPFFRGRIDKTSQSIGKTSIQLFTLNQLRFCVAELLLGNSIQTADQLGKSVAERLNLENGKAYEEAVIDFYKIFAQYNQYWKGVSEQSGRPGDVKVDIPEHRENFVDMTATGLQVISRVGYHILKVSSESRETYIQKLAELDYRRIAPMWQGNIIEDEKLRTNNPAVKKATAVVKQAIGLEVPSEDAASDQAFLDLIAS